MGHSICCCYISMRSVIVLTLDRAPLGETSKGRARATWICYVYFSLPVNFLFVFLYPALLLINKFRFPVVAFVKSFSGNNSFAHHFQKEGEENGKHCSALLDFTLKSARQMDRQSRSAHQKREIALRLLNEVGVDVRNSFRFFSVFISSTTCVPH